MDLFPAVTTTAQSKYFSFRISLTYTTPSGQFEEMYAFQMQTV